MRKALVGGKKPGPHERTWGAFLLFDTARFFIGWHFTDLNIGAVGESERTIYYTLYINPLPCLSLVVRWQREIRVKATSAPGQTDTSLQSDRKDTDAS